MNLVTPANTVASPDPPPLPLRLPLFDFALVLNPTSSRPCPSARVCLPPRFVNTHQTCAADDPQKVVKVVASDGKTGDQCELSYTNCKVVGNGSFGVVFQAKLVGGNLSPSSSGDTSGDDDVAIKKVLQDKRFKVSLVLPSPRVSDGFATETHHTGGDAEPEYRPVSRGAC